MNYEELVNQAQMNFSNYYYQCYAQGKVPYPLSNKQPLPYDKQISILVEKIKEADCVIIGAASGLSAAGGGDFYYEANDSYKTYFKPFYEKYKFNGAFAGMMHQFSTREEHWGYVSTFLHTTLTAPLRKPYIDLDHLLKGKDFFILTTNQDTQFTKIYNENQIAQIQGDHRYFQCAKGCSDYIWDSVETVEKMYNSMNGGRFVSKELIPHCPHCDSEAFPYVRGYGNFLQGTKYHSEYAKMSKYLETHANKKVVYIELGVGRMTPMFIQEPFWFLTAANKDAFYISMNNQYNFLPKQIEEQGMVIVGDIAKTLADAVKLMDND